MLDTSRMNRILHWDPREGIASVEPGVTIGQLWRYTLEDGWWPAVVPGTLHPTIGGCAAVNVHGKNNWHAGTVGDWIEEFQLLLPSGQKRTCNRRQNTDLFRAAIGGLGMLGVFLSITLRLKRVTSGLLRTRQFAVRNLEDMFVQFGRLSGESDYVVGWVDAFARGASLGRGLVQAASYVDHDPAATTTLRADYQDLPDTLFGVVPRSRLWLAMKATTNDPGMRALNALRYRSGSHRQGRVAYVPHAQFHFFLDYVPHWKRAFNPDGIVQYQIFVPRARAMDVFAAVLERSRAAGFVPYLTVFKRHSEDDFLLRYNVDGYSLALDYRAGPGRESAIRRLLDGLTEDVVLPAGGRFYPAKDTLLRADQAREVFGANAVDEYLAVKRRVDPGNCCRANCIGDSFRKRRLRPPPQLSLSGEREPRAGNSDRVFRLSDRNSNFWELEHVGESEVPAVPRWIEFVIELLQRLKLIDRGQLVVQKSARDVESV